jgi:hypothetical protein
METQPAFSTPPGTRELGDSGVPSTRTRWSKALGAGTAVIAGLAVLMRSQQAKATGCLGEPDCCTLATCTLCSYNVSHDRFDCVAEGGYRTTWTCIEAGTGRTVWCGECAGDPTNCRVGPFTCSTWFY